MVPLCAPPTRGRVISHQGPPSQKRADLHLRPPTIADGPALAALIRSCPPLDANSTYAYLLLCRDFADTCVVAVSADGEMAGAFTGYRPPARPDTFFFWQVAVAEKWRGCGVALAMLNHLIDRPQLADVRFIETTIGPDNVGSVRLFTRMAQQRQWQHVIKPLFDSQQLEPGHEPEFLHLIGPCDRVAVTTPSTH